jgi:hypothetical protein
MKLVGPISAWWRHPSRQTWWLALKSDHVHFRLVFLAIITIYSSSNSAEGIIVKLTL